MLVLNIDLCTLNPDSASYTLNPDYALYTFILNAILHPINPNLLPSTFNPKSASRTLNDNAVSSTLHSSYPINPTSAFRTVIPIPSTCRPYILRRHKSRDTLLLNPNSSCLRLIAHQSICCCCDIHSDWLTISSATPHLPFFNLRNVFPFPYQLAPSYRSPYSFDVAALAILQSLIRNCKVT